MTVDRVRCRAMQFAQRKAQYASFTSQGAEACRTRRRGHRGDRAQRLRRRSGSSVSMVAIRPAPKPSPVRIGSASAIVRSQPGDVVKRPRPKQETHRRRAIGEGGGDAFQADLCDFVDRERQHMRRQPVAEPRQRVDQRRAMGIVMHQHDRLFAAGFAIGYQHRTKLAHQHIFRRQRVGSSAGRTGRRALPAACANIGVDRHVIARGRNGRCRTKIEATGATDDPGTGMGAQRVVVGDVTWLFEAAGKSRALKPPATSRQDCRDRPADNRRADRPPGTRQSRRSGQG